MVKIRTYKVRQHGEGYAIGLPKTWLDDAGLTPGDEVDVFREENSITLFLRPKDGSGSKKPSAVT